MSIALPGDSSRPSAATWPRATSSGRHSRPAARRPRPSFPPWSSLRHRQTLPAPPTTTPEPRADLSDLVHRGSPGRLGSFQGAYLSRDIGGLRRLWPNMEPIWAQRVPRGLRHHGLARLRLRERHDRPRDRSVHAHGEAADAASRRGAAPPQPVHHARPRARPPRHREHQGQIESVRGLGPWAFGLRRSPFRPSALGVRR